MIPIYIWNSLFNSWDEYYLLIHMLICMIIKGIDYGLLTNVIGFNFNGCLNEWVFINGVCVPRLSDFSKCKFYLPPMYFPLTADQGFYFMKIVCIRIR